MAASESYPDDLRYHPEHDWARIDGDEAVLGITWYAQDSLGELVLFDGPEAGATVTKDGSYAEVESVKAVSDVVAPTSGASNRTSSPSESCAYHVMPSTASSPSIRAQSCSGWYRRSTG